MAIPSCPDPTPPALGSRATIGLGHSVPERHRRAYARAITLSADSCRRLGEAITFTVAVGAWPLAAQATCALAVIVACTHDTAVAQLIAAVSRHVDDPGFADLSAGLRQRLGADAWLEASRVGLTLNADNLARVVQDCTGFTGS